MFKLLTRDKFREGVFARDKHKCVICGEPAQDAHHILERRLWNNGGYYLENGASVCGPCHLKCESTEISVETVREKAGIKKFPVPEHLYDDQSYDKWGNIVLPNGTRLKGDLFYDESIQRVISPYLNCFSNHVKYPRTYHLPWSGNINSDDRTLQDCSQFEDRLVVVHEKLDGENTTVYNDYIHARSLDSGNHWTRNWVKNYASNWQYELPEGWRICGENMFATHSIKYENLESYFYGFSIWNDKNICLDWMETLSWFELLGIKTPKLLYGGPWNEGLVRNLSIDLDKCEGYVVRLVNDFQYKDFRKSVAKFVRPGHIQTVKHWMHGTNLEVNKLYGQ